MRETFPRAELVALARRLGADPKQTSSITFAPREVTVTTFLLNADGYRYSADCGKDFATETTVIPVGGAE